MAPIINSVKNEFNNAFGVTGSTQTQIFADAVNAPTSNKEVMRGSIIKAVWFSFDVCGLGGTGVLNNFFAYMFKNPGSNLTAPDPTAVGISNEKKFVFKSWSAMIMRNQDGNAPYHWEGWVKIPKRYQRMGINDTLSIVIICTSGVTGHTKMEFIYKWFI